MIDIFSKLIDNILKLIDKFVELTDKALNRQAFATANADCIGKRTIETSRDRF